MRVFFRGAPFFIPMGRGFPNPASGPKPLCSFAEMPNARQAHHTRNGNLDPTFPTFRNGGRDFLRCRISLAMAASFSTRLRPSLKHECDGLIVDPRRNHNAIVSMRRVPRNREASSVRERVTSTQV